MYDHHAQPVTRLYDPKLDELVSVRVLKSFGLGRGRFAQVGSVIEIPRHLAQDMCSIKKAQLVA